MGADQRNEYKGHPPRPWMRVRLVAANGDMSDMDVVIDTGNPFALIVRHEALEWSALRRTRPVATNFGRLSGGWVRLLVPGTSFDGELLAYSGDAVVSAVEASHRDFAGLAGLPLLRMFEYGGDQNAFWVRDSSVTRSMHQH